jgi:hypothetical protein
MATQASRGLPAQVPWDAAPRSRHATDRLRGLAVPAAVVAAVLTATAHLLNAWLPGLTWAALDADVNWSISDTASVVAIAVATLALASVAISAGRLVLIPLIALLAFLAVDDAIQVHQRLGDAWESAIVLPAAALLIWFSYSYDRFGGRLVRLGVLALGCSFLIGEVERVVELAGWSLAGAPFQLKAAAKQATEIAGWILVAFGAVLVAMRSDCEPGPSVSSARASLQSNFLPLEGEERQN